jgi:putative transposase
MGGHPGYAKHGPGGRGGGQSRTGYRGEAVLPGGGPVKVPVRRDRDPGVVPQVAAKRRRHLLAGTGGMVIFLPAAGLAHGEVAAHLAGVHGAEGPGQMISHVTGRVTGKVAGWRDRRREAGRVVLVTGAVSVKARGGAVAGPTRLRCAGRHRGRRAGHPGPGGGEPGGGEGATYGLRALTEIKNRGVSGVLILAGGGLEGLPGAVSTVREKAIARACIAPFLRGSSRGAPGTGPGRRSRRTSRPVHPAAAGPGAPGRGRRVPGRSGRSATRPP